MVGGIVLANHFLVCLVKIARKNQAIFNGFYLSIAMCGRCETLER